MHHHHSFFSHLGHDLDHIGKDILHIGENVIENFAKHEAENLLETAVETIL